MIFLLLPDVEILDVAGPLQTFHQANAIEHRFVIRTCALTDRIRTDQGLLLAGLEPLPEAQEGDLVVVPGMRYRATERIDSRAVRWLKTSAAAGAQLASICTGAFILGEAGLLDGRRCTTHWSRTMELKRRFPGARVLDNRLFVSDGPVTTSAGIASGIDMALAIIERSHGPLAAAAVAREMVVYLRRDGAHDQESIYLDYRTHLHPGIHRVQDWLTRHPAAKSTLPELATVAGMSARNLTRQFRQTTGITIKDFATRVRLELARTLLHDPELTVDAVANRCGFDNARQLRRIWQAAFGGTPRGMAAG
ncbi:MAG: AraC family transcriptional regulator [Acidobacteria bacterium]|nr:AraC family transcriptional regulator [Acidobacteriota bacterium]